MLAAVVGRVGLAREDNLDGSILVVQDRGKAVGVVEKQRRAFVRRESSGEPKREHLLFQEWTT